jgi:predicted esterase
VSCSGASAPPACFSAALAASADAKKAVQWFRRNAGPLKVDPTRISMGGTSAGAVASVLVAASPSAAGSGEPSSTISTAFSISGGSPTNIVFNAGDSSIFFWHGTSDTVVPIAWARSNVQTMQSKGLDGQIHEIAGAGHVPFGQYGDDMDTQATNWVYSHMTLGGAAQGGFPGAP